MSEFVVSMRWGIEIPQSASVAYNAVRKRWVEQSKTLVEAKENALCACEECGVSLEGQRVHETPYTWVCLDCAEVDWGRGDAGDDRFVRRAESGWRE